MGTDGGYVAVYDVTQEEEIIKLPTQGDWIRCIRFSPDGRLLIAGTHEGSIELWEQLKPDSHQVHSLSDLSVRSMVFSGDGRFLATSLEEYGGYRAQVSIVELSSLDVVVSRGFARKRSSWGIQFIPQDEYLLTTTSMSFALSKLPVDDLQSKSPLCQLESGSVIGPIAISPEKNLVVAGGSNGELVAWDLRNGAVAEAWPGHFQQIMDIAFFPEGQRMVTCSQDGIVRCWSVGDDVPVQLPWEFPVGAVSTAFSPDSRTMYVAGYAGDQFACGAGTLRAMSFVGWSNCRRLAAPT